MRRTAYSISQFPVSKIKVEPKSSVERYEELANNIIAFSRDKEAEGIVSPESILQMDITLSLSRKILELEARIIELEAKQS